ncbi:ankyrin repeat domain-containing protein [Klebsiella variicola]|uniref:ankyrin repeat domain-containing protein n=1 Tax=Klebsiella variicola TaxID=244366 RepID=UPI000B3C6D44|nr:ankyrin repeat domain-containing protein [Klebsiella variicola]AVZ99132.1 ankyrin repeat domain-containing protein [Klebsiella variicola]MCJ7050187.1 hypothetical protein [Klebsiella variicola]
MKVIKGLALLCLLMLAGCQSEEETSQFLLACKYDAPATIEAMLNNGIDVDGQDKTGLSGLMVAAAENRRDVVALLLKRQAKPNLQTRQGVTALMLAAARGSDAAIIGDLLQAGASVNQTSVEKSTALMSAIADGGDVRNDYQHILAMKKPDAPVEKESALDKIVGATAAKSLATGNRALMTEDMALQLAPGAFKKNVDEIVALLEAGASVNLSNKAGYTAIGYSRAGEVRQLLLAQHAELKGQAAHMAQSELQFCANAFADKLAYSDIARAVNNDTRPDIMRHQQSCPELGELTMLLGEFKFNPAGSTYLGEPVTCKVSEYRKAFEVTCR